MADNIAVTPGTGVTIAADDIAGVLVQRVKPTWGVDGTATDVSTANPLPVAVPGSVAVTGAFYQATQPVSLASTPGLTDTQLRATAVPVSGPVTDAQLRASAVPVSVGSALPAGTNIIGAVSSAPLPAGTDKSGSITTGGTAQVLAAANTARIALSGQNIDATADLWINEIGGTAAANTAGSFKVAAGCTFSISTNRAISIVGATTGQKFTATEV